MSDDTRAVIERLRALHDADDGCGDSSCEVARSRGMCTNGGCQCLDGMRLSAQRAVRLRLMVMRRELPALLDAVEAAATVHGWAGGCLDNCNGDPCKCGMIGLRGALDAIGRLR